MISGRAPGVRCQETSRRRTGPAVRSTLMPGISSAFTASFFCHRLLLKPLQDSHPKTKGHLLPGGKVARRRRPGAEIEGANSMWRRWRPDRASYGGTRGVWSRQQRSEWLSAFVRGWERRRDCRRRLAEVGEVDG